MSELRYKDPSTRRSGRDGTLAESLYGKTGEAGVDNTSCFATASQIVSDQSHKYTMQTHSKVILMRHWSE